MAKILIVDDEPKLREELEYFLINNGYEVEVLLSFDNTINYIKENKFDLVLIDINIPNLNGEIVCKEVRKYSNVPIIIITSRNTEADEIISINYGADDFITKPFNTQILLARIERLLKRTNYFEPLTYQDMILDVSKSCIIKNKIVTDLSKNEFRILYYLLSNRGKIISRDALMNYLWDNDAFIDDNALTVNINRVRNKLASLGYQEVISTRRGQGYIIL